ncbi:hypothetical protein IU449_05540 [Nocardia higoensis]|uniref:Restriction endonuclease subunit S n=1 Tax=Nocardia higoensis TaxID=228599 RepID=A0ABS0D882_9NOCA|nr:hypothetical protein [Nocardia higoensis]MBF6354018.1 hypothetical protein [Nocardia higoensis]
MTDRRDDYAALRSALLEEPLVTPPELIADATTRGAVAIEDLIGATALSVHQSPPTVGVGGGTVALLTAKDVRLDRPPSRWGSADTPGAVTVRAGDVAVVMGADAAVGVCSQDGVLLGPGIHLLRGHPETLDAWFLACVLRGALEAAEGRPLDLYQVRVPRIPLTEQRRRGAAFLGLVELESSWRRRRASIEGVMRAGIGGLATGTLRPALDDRRGR